MIRGLEYLKNTQPFIRNYDEMLICKVPTPHLESLRTNRETADHRNHMTTRYDQATEGKHLANISFRATKLEES